MPRFNLHRLLYCLAWHAAGFVTIQAAADDGGSTVDQGLTAHLDYRILHDSNMYRSPGSDAENFIGTQPKIMTTAGGGVNLNETESRQKLTMSFDWDRSDFPGYLRDAEVWNAKGDWEWHVQDRLSGDAQINAFRNFLSFESSGPGVVDFDNGKVATVSVFFPIHQEFALYIEPTVDRERHSEAKYLDSNLASFASGVSWTSSDRTQLQIFLEKDKLNYVLAGNESATSQANYIENQLGLAASWVATDKIKLDAKFAIISWHYISGSQQFRDTTGEIGIAFKPSLDQQIHVDVSRAYNQVDNNQYRQEHDIALLEWSHSITAKTQMKLAASRGWSKDIVPVNTPSYSERLSVERLEFDWDPTRPAHVRIFFENRVRHSEDVDLAFSAHLVGTSFRYDF